MADSAASGGSGPVDLGKVQNDLTSLSQGASNGNLSLLQLDPKTKQIPTDPKNFQFDVQAARDAVGACNLMAQYFNGISGAVQDLKLDPTKVVGLDSAAPGGSDFSTPGVASTMNLVDQFNDAHDNILQVLDVHKTLLKDIISTFEHACGLLKATDANSASNTNSTSDISQINSELNDIANAVQQSGQDSGDQWQDVMADSVNPIKVPTFGDSAKTFQSWTNATYGDAADWNLPASSPAAKYASVTDWTNLPDFQPGDVGPKFVQGAPIYTGSYVTQGQTAAPKELMDWYALFLLSKLNAEYVAEKAAVWNYLGGKLDDAFRDFANAMARATTQAGWSGAGAQAAAEAMAAYSATGPDLASCMTYFGWLLSNTANWMGTTKEYMPTIEQPPSTSIVPAKLTRTWHGGISLTSWNVKHTGQFATNVEIDKDKIAVVYQGGMIQDKPPIVDNKLTAYYLDNYSNLYCTGYNAASLSVPAVQSPAPVTDTPNSQGGGPNNQTGAGNPGGGGVTGGGGGGVTGGGGGAVSLPSGGGIPATAMVSIPSAGSGLGSLNNAGLAGANVPALALGNAAQPAVDLGNATQTPADAGAIPGSSADAPPVGATTPADYTGPTSGADPASAAAGAAQSIAGAAQQGMNAAEQGMNPSSQQQQLAQAAERAGAMMDEARAGLPPTGRDGAAGGGPVEDIAGETSALEAKSGLTAAAKLFPRAGALASSEEGLLGRAGAAPMEPEGGSGYPGGMGSPATGSRGNESKGHRTPGYRNSRRHLHKAMGDAPLASISVVEEK